MSKIDDGGSCTPDMVARRQIDENTIVEDRITMVGGIKLRDYFAAAALTGEVGGEDFGEEIAQLRDPENAKLMAKRAYMLADAMLAARKEEQP